VHLLDKSQPWDPFPPTTHREEAAHRRQAHQAIGVSAVGLAVTGAAELAIAVLSGSVGLLGDALHNISDVSTSLVVFVGFRLSKRPASANHPYGYERAEDLAGLAVALVVWASAVFAGAVSIHKLAAQGHTSHLAFGMAAALAASPATSWSPATSAGSAGASSRSPCWPTPPTRGSTRSPPPAPSSAWSASPSVCRGQTARPG
jgi:hypothetical protein